MEKFMEKEKIAVLIPCYNEEITVGKVVQDFRRELPDADIYVYDNNSVDKTAEIAKANGAIVIPEFNQGKGNVVKSMFYDIDADYYIMVDGDEYKMDLLMYHLKMHRYVVIELKAVEFIPEFVSKLNFYISAVDEYIKTPQDNPTIGLLLCPTKSNEKVRFSLRGFSQPMGVAEYEIKQLIEEVQSALPSIEEKA